MKLIKNISLIVTTALFAALVPQQAQAAITYTCAGTKATIVSAKATVTGTEGKDIIVLIGTFGQNVNAGGGDDVICGSKYNDVINAGSGNDTVYGNLGSDLISGGSGTDKIYGNDGADNINAGDGNDLVYGGNGNDIIEGGTGNDTIYGDAGDDTLTGNIGDDKFYGGAGKDKLYGGAGKDSLRGDSGDDKIYGDDGDDKLYGGTNNDTIYGGKGKDLIDGNDGNDKLYGDSENDTLSGGNGDDVLNGGSGDDTLNGNAGANKITGGKGADKKTIGPKDTDIDPSSQDTVNGGSGTDPEEPPAPTDPVPDAVKKFLAGGVKTYLDKAMAQNELTGKGWQDVFPDSSNNTVPTMTGYTLTKVVWNGTTKSYCVSVLKDSKNYRMNVKGTSVTYEAASCSDTFKSLTAPTLLSSLLDIYTEYMIKAVRKGDIAAEGNNAGLPSSSVGTPPSFSEISNVKWKKGATTTKVIISGSLDGINFFRRVVVISATTETRETIAGVGASRNL